MTWKPWLGAVPDAQGTHFRVWAPKADSLSVRVLDGPTVSLQREGDGYFASVSDLMVGILFVFLLMLTIFALNYRQAEQDQLVQRSLYERLAAELQQQKAETERQTAEAQSQLGYLTGFGFDLQPINI